MSGQINISMQNFGKVSANADYLVVEINGQSVSFCGIKEETTAPLFVYHYKSGSNLPGLDLPAVFSDLRIDPSGSKKVFINYNTSLFTLCPSILSAGLSHRELLEYNVGSVGDQVVLTDEIGAEVQFIWSVNDQLKSLLDKSIPNHHLRHQLSVLSELFLRSEEFAKTSVLLMLESNHAALLVKEGQSLLLANRYEIHSAEDILYYLLFVTEQFQLNPATLQLSVAGNIETDSEIILFLKKYIKHVTPVKGHKSITWTELSGMPQHFNYTLLNRLFCE